MVSKKDGASKKLAKRPTSKKPQKPVRDENRLQIKNRVLEPNKGFVYQSK